MSDKNPVLLALLKEVESLDTTFLNIDIKVVPVQNTQLIKITVEDDSPTLAAAVANTLARSLLPRIQSRSPIKTQRPRPIYRECRPATSLP